MTRHPDLLLHLVAALVGTIAVARAARLITSDHYPPAEALRRWWLNRTEAHDDWRHGWGLLAECPFCFAPYAAAADLAWYLLADQHGWLATAWWVVNVWAAVSYVAAMIVVRDEPPPV